MDLIEPGSQGEVREALFGASERGTRVSIVGGRTHGDKGNPCEVDMELSTSGLDRVIAYDPAEMLAVVEGGMRIGDLRRVLAEGGQEWPADALRRRDRRRDDRDRVVLASSTPDGSACATPSSRSSS